MRNMQREESCEKVHCTFRCVLLTVSLRLLCKNHKILLNAEQRVCTRDLATQQLQPSSYHAQVWKTYTFL